MKNIYVDTGELSEKLLNRTIEKMEVAKKKMGYNYSADAFLEVAISMAKYNSPSGRQSLFNAHFAEMAGSLYGDIEDVLKKLSDLKTILQKQPEELCEIDERQKGEISNFWWRTSYYLDEPSAFFATIFGLGGVDPNCTIELLTDEQKQDYIKTHYEGKPFISKEQMEQIASNCHTETELREAIDAAISEKYNSYRQTVDDINTQLPVGQKQDDAGWKCTWASIATILNRKQVTNDANPSFSREGVYQSNPSMYWERTYSSDGKTYKTATRDTSGTGISEQELVKLLVEHPEGVQIYVKHPSNYHAIVVTDFEINSNGTYQFYADDPVNNKSSNYPDGRVKIEETWLYSQEKDLLGNTRRVTYVR